jgi:hypothetical protein
VVLLLLETTMRIKLLSCPAPREFDSEADPLVSHNEGYEQYLIDRGYAAGYIKCCKGGVAHLSQWMGSTQKKAGEVGEALIVEFLDVHLPRCSCGSVIHDRSSLRAALGHERVNTTHQYVEADLSMKEKALGNIEEPDTKLKRFRASDSLMRFLEAL